MARQPKQHQDDPADQNDKATGEGMAEAPAEPAGGVYSYDPDKPAIRPGQAPHRDDPVDTEFRRTQGMSGAGHAISAAGELLEADPFSVQHPALAADTEQRIPGAGDPQNGVVFHDWRQSPISWVQATSDVAQHYTTTHEKPATPAPA